MSKIWQAKAMSLSSMVYSMTEKTISGIHVHVSPGSAETLVRRGGITNHHSVLSQQCISQKSVGVR